MSDIWKDAEVKEALKDRRTPDDIWVMACPKCNQWSYYNQGSHFYCKPCNTLFYVLGKDEPRPDEITPCVNASEAVTLADTVTEVTDGYENETKPKET